MNLNTHLLRRFIAIVGVITFAAMPSLAVEWWVAQDGQTPDPNGLYTNRATAATDIQTAINKTSNGDTVWVAPGTYGRPPTPIEKSGITNMVTINKWITVRSSSGNPTDTIIDAGGAASNRCVWIDATLSAGADSTARLIGFTVTNGFADGGGVFFNLTNLRRTAIVDNCIVIGNRGISSAGGLYGQYTGSPSASLIVTNTLIRNNSGGGMWKRSTADLNVVDSRFENNTPNGLSWYDGTNRVERCVFTSNAKTNASGSAALTISKSSGGNSYNEVRNSLFYDNRFIHTVETPSGASAIMAYNGSVTDIYNCTIVSNFQSSGVYGGALYSQGGSVFRIWNSIVRDNYKGGAEVNTAANATGSLFVFTNSCTPLIESSQASFPAEANNINVDPQYVNPTGNDFRLKKSSLCLNTGTNQAWMTSAIDLNKNRRLDTLYNRVDMGCYEYVYELGTTIIVK